MTVYILVQQAVVNGWSPEELKCQFPELTMSQIHSALAYYYDHPVEMEANVRADEAVEEQGPVFRQVSRDSLLKRRGKQPQH